MPVSARSTGTGTRVRGGQRLRRYVAALTNPDVVARAFAQVVRRRVLPRLKNKVARRSGRLGQSLNIRQRGANTELRGIFYAPLVQFRSGRDTVAQRVMTILESDRSAIRRQLALEIRRQAGV